MLTGSAADTNSGSSNGVDADDGATGKRRPLPTAPILSSRPHQVVLPTAGAARALTAASPPCAQRVDAGPRSRPSAAARAAAAGDRWKYAWALWGSRQPPRACNSAGVIPRATCWLAQK